MTGTSSSSGPPSAVSVTPGAGSGSAQTFAFAFSDPGGAANIVSAQMDVSGSLVAAGACYLYYSRAANAVYLANDAGAFQSPLTIGSPGTSQNSQCMVDAGASRVSASGTNLTLNLALSFKPAYAGDKNIYATVYNGTQDSGWVLEGRWTAQ